MLCSDGSQSDSLVVVCTLDREVKYFWVREFPYWLALTHDPSYLEVPSERNSGRLLSGGHRAVVIPFFETDEHAIQNRGAGIIGPSVTQICSYSLST